MQNYQEKYQELLGLLGRADDLARAAGLLEWDQQTYMPAGGAAARAGQLATLRGLAHETFTSPRVGELLQELAPWAEEQGDESTPANLIRVVTRDYERERKLPASLVAEKAEAVGLAMDAWQRAKRSADFSFFQPHLERLVELNVAEAEALGYEGERYDALVDRYEPGMKTSLLLEVFGRLERELAPLVRSVFALGPRPDPLAGKVFPAGAQLTFGRELLTAMGFDFDRGRLDQSEHPFTSGFAPGDVRVTTHVYETSPLSNIFAVIHEGGHALYEQGLPSEYARTPLGNAASLGVHESQSRLWENVIGRSRPFWEYFYPRLRAFFPSQLDEVSLEDFLRVINRVQPALIRIEADELTYNLHIILRFHLERELLNGTVRAGDLPGLWRERMEKYLGIVPKNDAEGVLQDVHWAAGLIGYFPAYTLGNIIAGQLYALMTDELPGLNDEIKAGNLAVVKQWLNRKVHVHGAKYEPAELVRRVTGTDLDIEPYLGYLKGKLAEYYGV
ncbi:MAG: carboxypeptidase M32 [Firmicutes bacterium]|nr:carboxypeptidase M32 [Bacillota bacterium]